MKKNTSMHVKIGDTIQIIAGNQKGFVGNIQSIIRKKSLVIVEGLIPRIKYVKNAQGGEAKKVELQLPIHISNVMLWDKANNQHSRIGYKLVGDEKKRYYKKSGTVL